VETERNGTTITYRLNITVLEEALMALFDAFRLQAGGKPGDRK